MSTDREQMEQLHIPIIDLGPFTIPNYTKKSKDETLDELAACCEDMGCFYLTNHGVDHDLIKETLDDFRAFTDREDEYKKKFKDAENNVNRGYYGNEMLNLNRFMGRQGHPNDPLEAYLIEPPESDVRRVNEKLWPNHPPTFKSNSQSYYEAMCKLSDDLFHVFALAMRAPGFERWISDRCQRGVHRLKMQHYRSSKSIDGQLDRFPVHTDSNPFAILITRACPGSLQMLDERRKRWVSIRPMENMFVVNLGDTMERWTNGVWKAPVHKVAWPDTKEGGPTRMAMIFFPHANPDAMMEAVPKFVPEGERPKWEPISCAEYVAEKIKAATAAFRVARVEQQGA